MKALFIGGTGNISAAATRLALAQGIEVVHLNRGNRPPMPGVRTIQADIGRQDETRAALGGERFDSVVNWIAFIQDDVQRDYELFAGCAGQYVFISSASVYQKPLNTPFVTESTPLHNPLWEYSRLKIAAENRCLDLYRDKGFPAVIVRPAHTYQTVIPVALGGWNCFTAIDRIRRGRPMVVHGDGSSLWTMTHSEDFAKGLVPLLGNPYAVGEAFHITSDEVLTWNQIYAAVGEAAGVEPKLVYVPSKFICQVEPDETGSILGDKAHSIIFDNSKIKRYVPGFQATIPFRAGIKRTVEWFEADPARQIIKQRHNDIVDRIIAAYGHDAPA